MAPLQNEGTKTKLYLAPVSENARILSKVGCQDHYSWGHSESQLLAQLRRARRLLLRNYLVRTWGDFQPQDLLKFGRRVTALAWHPKEPYLMSAACKGGDLIVAKGEKGEDGVKFKPMVISQGIGPGGAIFSIKFDENHPHQLYTASLSGVVQRQGLINPGKNLMVYDETGDWNIWYTGMDVNFQKNLVVAGDNKGFLKLFDLRSGSKIQSLRIHGGKIHHCEFNRRDSNLLATGALDERNPVCIWDVRKLKESKIEPVKHFHDFRGVNLASFNADGSRLLVNDQQDLIKVYQGPIWTDVLTINHPHRQFQHITSMEACWHPLDDVIVMGRYPKAEYPKAKPVPLRPIEFFDGRSGEVLHRLYHPVNGIVSLNAFSPMGDVMASGMGFNVTLWQATKGLEKLGAPKKARKVATISSTMRSAIRGENAGRDSDSEEDDVSRTKKATATKRKNVTSAKQKSKLSTVTKNSSRDQEKKPAASTSKTSGKKKGPSVERPTHGSTEATQIQTVAPSSGARKRKDQSNEKSKEDEKVKRCRS